MSRTSQVGLLRAVFRNVYNEDFQAHIMDERVKLQKAVFLMREMGISCGDYEFVWDHYGPFSARLSDDMKQPISSDTEASIKFNSEAINIMKTIREAFSRDTTYSVRYWAEAITSLLYLKKYIYPSYTDERLIESLEELKPYLNNHHENLQAINCLNEILAV